VKNEYLPPGMVLQDPRNMNLDDIRKVLQHCYGRQAECGPGSAFKFGIFIGAKRKPMFAEYPETSNPGPNEADKNRRKKKGKGRQKEDPLEGLLRIDESEGHPSAERGEDEDRVMNPSSAGPSNEISLPTGLIRIDMAQMLVLKEMGCEVFGPVNGPNEGYPEYEVPQAVFEMLKSQGQLESGPNVHDAQQCSGTLRADSAPNAIDPTLLGQTEDIAHTSSLTLDGGDIPSETTHQNEPMTQPAVNPLISSLPSSSSYLRPTTPGNNDAGSETPAQEALTRTPKKRLGKRPQVNVSPQTTRPTRGNNKKKKVSADDRAALEAQNMIQSGSRRKSKPTRRQ
jgi:hypothetical protein